MIADLFRRLISRYAFHLKIVITLLWIFAVSYLLKFQDTPKRSHNGYIRSKTLFAYCLDVDGVGEVTLALCKSNQSPRWHLRKNMLSEESSRKCVSYDLFLVTCNQASKWSYNQRNKWIVNDSLQKCLALDFDTKTLHQWECSKENDFAKWEFIEDSFEAENDY